MEFVAVAQQAPCEVGAHKAGAASKDDPFHLGVASSTTKALPGWLVGRRTWPPRAAEPHSKTSLLVFADLIKAIPGLQVIECL